MAKTALSRDFRDLLSALAAHDVRYLLVGGYAVAFHGVPRFTKDLDLLVDLDANNLEKLAQAFIAFGAPEELVTHARALTRETILFLGVAPHAFEILPFIPGIDFASAYARCDRSEWDGVAVTVISKVDLIAAKQASGRPQDLLDVRSLAQEP